MVVDEKDVMEILVVRLAMVCLGEEMPMVWRGLGGVPMVWHISTSIVGTDIRMSNLDIRLSNLDIRMSSLDIRMSKLILEFGKNKTAKNSEILVAFRMFFQIFNTPYC